MPIGWELWSGVLVNWVLGTSKKEAILGIPVVSAVDTAVGLPLLRLLPTTVKLSSSVLLSALIGKPWKIG